MTSWLVFVAWISSTVAGLTVFALLSDAVAMPTKRTGRAFTHHWARLIVLIVIGGFAGLVFLNPWALGDKPIAVGILAAMAANMATSCPCPWWRYVFMDRHPTKAQPLEMKTR